MSVLLKISVSMVLLTATTVCNERAARSPTRTSRTKTVWIILILGTISIWSAPDTFHNLKLLSSERPHSFPLSFSLIGRRTSRLRIAITDKGTRIYQSQSRLLAINPLNYVRFSLLSWYIYFNTTSLKHHRKRRLRKITGSIERSIYKYYCYYFLNLIL